MKANKKYPKTTVCKECTYVQNDRDKIDEIFDLPPDNEHTFSASYFHKKPIVDVKYTEERLKEINLKRVQKNDMNYHYKNITKR